jgi:hypothetical protein
MYLVAVEGFGFLFQCGVTGRFQTTPRAPRVEIGDDDDTCASVGQVRQSCCVGVCFTLFFAVGEDLLVSVNGVGWEERTRGRVVDQRRGQQC